MAEGPGFDAETGGESAPEALRVASAGWGTGMGFGAGAAPPHAAKTNANMARADKMVCLVWDLASRRSRRFLLGNWTYEGVDIECVI